MTRPYHKRIKPDSQLTDAELSVRKQIIDTYCSSRLEDFDKHWSKKYYFSNSPNDFVKLVDYHKTPYSTDINEKLEGINFERVERDTTSNFLEALDQARVIIGSLNKSYKQRIISSDELTNFILTLLELDEWTEKKDVYRFALAQNLFNTAMKILIDESPKPIRKHLVQNIMTFYDFAKLPIELGYRYDKSLVRPQFRKIEGSDDYQIELETQMISTKPKYSKIKV